ncbi:hypothetical protein NNC97_13405 [Prevotella copri]|jgi:hypothetical protein|uniref:Uncharacterized protein n=1 Tax=Segatella copri TaxID=165179 RepID=A0AAW5ILT2_9BACT|nr:hypothetical protein [Segatella copri]MCP9541495.1 hypothetical protein [Segatella copri]MCP9562666.1 hypothetical protein [Segatella copri]MCP9565592.1 hypothetical protein [Segatella copri]
MINILPSKLRFFLETTKKKAENLQAISKLRNAPADKQSQSASPSPGGPSPHNLAQGFDAPPTIKRSGSEHRRAVTSSRP